MSTALIDIVREVQRETTAGPIGRPIARPRYPGDPFWDGERLESAMREAGVSPEDFRRSRKVVGRGRRS